MAMWLSDTQKVGVAFCCGGGFFLIFGVMMFFDRAMLAMGNILFLIGLTIMIGPAKTFLFFFARRQKAKGTAAFFAGLAMILFLGGRVGALLGFLVELYGMAVLFGDFLGTALGFARGFPVVGPYVGAAGDRLLALMGAVTGAGPGAGRRNADLPV